MRHKNGHITGKVAYAMRQKRKENQTLFWHRLGVTQSGGCRYEHGRNIPEAVKLLLLLLASGKLTSADLEAAVARI